MIKNFSSKLSKVGSNSTISFVLSRYLTYFIQFVNSILIALYLGPKYLAVWGFITLVLQYLEQLNFGIPYSLNNILSLNKLSPNYCEKILNNSLFLVSFYGILVCGLLVIITFYYELGTKYNFSKYLVFIVLISLLTSYNSLFTNVFRVYAKINLIAISQSLYPVLTLCILPFFRSEILIEALLWVNVVSVFTVFILFIAFIPIKIRFYIARDIYRKIQIKGWYLFIYNASFYFIFLFTRLFVSNNYSVIQFGYFTFVYTMANIILLLSNTVAFLILPKMLHRFSIMNNAETFNVMKEARNIYISLAHLSVHFLIMIYPLAVYFFKDYYPTITLFNLVALTVVLYTNSFTFQELAMARQKERQLSLIAFLSLIVNVILLTILIFIIKVDFIYIIFATTFTYFLYVIILARFSITILGKQLSLFQIILLALPARIMFPFFISIFISLLQINVWFYTVPLIVFLICNLKSLMALKPLAYKIITDHNFIKI